MSQYDQTMLGPASSVEKLYAFRRGGPGSTPAGDKSVLDSHVDFNKFHILGLTLSTPKSMRKRRRRHLQKQDVNSNEQKGCSSAKMQE